MYAYFTVENMTFEVVLRRFLLPPSFTQQGGGKPRPVDKAHLLGKDKVQDISGGQNQGGRNEQEPKPGKYDARGARKLETISPKEIKRAYELYKAQLAHTSNTVEIVTNHFYMIDLEQREGMPALIFGRVHVCLPSDGHIQNIREMGLSFPQPGGKPDEVVLHPWDFSQQGNIQSYSFRLKCFFSDDEYAEFMRHEQAFREAGFVIGSSNPLDELLHADRTDDASLPWFHVIGSRWFADLTHSAKDDVRKSLWKLSARKTLIINYHPTYLLPTVKRLNEELDYQYRLTDYFLTDPQTPLQALHIARTVFDKVFSDLSSRSVHLSNRQNKIE